MVVEQDVEVIRNETAGGNATVVREQRELDRLETTIPHNESWHHEYALEPTMTGENQRIVWLLFPGGEVPAEPTMDDTEYSVHRGVNVSKSSTASERIAAAAD